MLAIIIEGVLLVALVAASGALFVFLVMTYTPYGRRLREVQNRKAIESAVELHCPLHGDQRQEDMVRLPTGDRVCPQCFKETVWQIR